MQDVNNQSSTDAAVTQRQILTISSVLKSEQRTQTAAGLPFSHLLQPFQDSSQFFALICPYPRSLPSWLTVPTQSISYHLVKPQVILKLFPSACKTHLQNTHTSQLLGQAERGRSHMRYPSFHELVSPSQPQPHELVERHFCTKHSLSCQI